MQSFSCLIVLSCFLLTESLAQPGPVPNVPGYRDKLELILELQDRRTIHNEKLITYLTDEEQTVREHAVRAFGSIQDTSVISLLVDRLTSDAAASVQTSAAFAIGQTAGFLSKPARETLEHDLIWVRLDQTKAVDRLIEEVGKFGTMQALGDLMTKFGDAAVDPHPRALTMAIARFAIRGVTASTATQYLLKRLKGRSGFTWQDMYALQRIGDKPEVRSELENVVTLFQHPDPLIRLNLAVLLGKLKDERTSIEPLQKLAEYDGDWKVRVAALKALASFHLSGNDGLLRIFRRAIYDGNTYVAVTAIASVGTAELSPADSSEAMNELVTALKTLAQNRESGYVWQLQAEAAIALAKILGARAWPYVTPSPYHVRPLQAQMLNAIGITGTPEALPELLRSARGDDKLLARAALEGLGELCSKNLHNKEIVNSTYDACLAALTTSDVGLVATAAAMVSDSLFPRERSVEPLLKKLRMLRVPDDVEAIQQIITTLGKLKDPRARKPLEQELEQPDRSVVVAAAAALKEITNEDYADRVKTDFEPLYTDFDFKYLRAVPETIRVKMETIRGDVIMDLYKDAAPFTVMSFLKLATQRGFYRGLSFHRVVPTFVVQGGDPRGDGWGGAGYSIRSEFSPLTYERGTMGIASAGKDTEGSQFFITQSPQPHLDGRYTIFGKVVSGSDVVDKIQIDDHIFDIKIVR